MSKQTMIATGRTVGGKLVVESATETMPADLAIANLDAANWRVCREMGVIPPGAVQGQVQHLALVDAVTKAVKP